MLGLRHLLLLVRLLVEDRQRLVLENVALRHQLAVLKRSVKRPRIQDSDRVFWILLKRMLADWRDALHFVKPDTVVRWHRKGFRYYWRRKSKSTPGRPSISMGIIYLIRRMSIENTTWGAPKIAAELALLGHVVADSTVVKYMVKVRMTDPSQRWGTFIRNHMDVTAACDFFVVPTATFKVLYVFVVPRTPVGGSCTSTSLNTRLRCGRPAKSWRRSQMTCPGYCSTTEMRSTGGSSTGW